MGTLGRERWDGNVAMGGVTKGTLGQKRCGGEKYDGKIKGDEKFEVGTLGRECCNRGRYDENVGKRLLR